MPALSRYGLVIVVLAACAVQLATAHVFTKATRCMQGERSMLTVKEADAYIPYRGRIRPTSALLSDPTPSVSFSPSPPAITDGGSVTLTITLTNWTPTPDDYVIFSCGPTQGLDDYIDAIPILDGAMNDTLQVTFTDLVFLRCDYTFVYVGAVYWPILSHQAIGSITVPSFEGPGAPKQGHLSYPGDPTQMTVQYITGPLATPPSVRYGTSRHNLHTTVEGTSTTYAASDMCHDTANMTSQNLFRDPGFIHTIALTGLQPDTQYFYQYGNDEGGWSLLKSFRTAPDFSRGVFFIAFADQDVIEPSRNTSDIVYTAALTGKLDFVLHFGDLGYALGKHWIWDKWGTLIEAGASLVPYMVSPGNHEYDHDTGHEKDPSHDPPTGPSGFVPAWWANGPRASNGECGVPLFKRFAAPPTGNSVFWYSFEYGNTFIIQMSSEHNFTAGAPQWLWLQSTLQSVNRTRTPWVVVTAHRPIYTTQECETEDFVVGLHMRAALDDLFYKYQVNLALVAHTHAYERTYPVYGGQIAQDGRGTVHITVGSAGAGLETCGYSPRYGNFSAAHINAWGALRVQTTDTAMLLQFVLDSDGSVWDEAEVKPWPQ